MVIPITIGCKSQFFIVNPSVFVLKKHRKTTIFLRSQKKTGWNFGTAVSLIESLFFGKIHGFSIFHGFSCSFPAFPTFSPRSQRRKFGIRLPGGRKSRAKGSKAADANAANAGARSARSQAILGLRKKASFG
jgi:hypothetical protein